MTEYPIFVATMDLCASVFATLTSEEKAEIIDAHAKSENVQINWGLDLIRGLLKNENNLVVEANQCELKGSYNDTRSEYKAGRYSSQNREAVFRWSLRKRGNITSRS